MNNRKIRRGLSLLLLLLVFALQLAMVASAESFVTWVGSNGYPLIATAEKNPNVIASRVDVITSTKIYHVVGTENQFMVGDYKIAYTNRIAPSSEYHSRIVEAANKEGMKETYTATCHMIINADIDNDGLIEYTVTIPASAPSGYYGIKTKVYGYVGTYKVEESGASGLRTLTSGNITLAPYKVSGEILGYGLVS